MNWRRYIFAFAITSLIFGTALYVSNYLSDRRVAEVRTTQDNISIDILSLETQFDLLAEQSCRDISENSVLSSDIQPLATRLSFLEQDRGFDDQELIRLKRFYSLLQIKDILLTEKVAAKCKLNPTVVLYFYSNKGDCPDCEVQGYVLSTLTKEYPNLRVYSFDYNLDLSSIRTLVSIHDIEATFPALVIDDTTLYGLKKRDELEKILPNLSKATSTPPVVK